MTSQENALPEAQGDGGGRIEDVKGASKDGLAVKAPVPAALSPVTPGNKSGMMFLLDLKLCIISSFGIRKTFDRSNHISEKHFQ